jgi:hypothetical protein
MRVWLPDDWMESALTGFLLPPPRAAQWQRGGGRGEGCLQV